MEAPPTSSFMSVEAATAESSLANLGTLLKTSHQLRLDVLSRIRAYSGWTRSSFPGSQPVSFCKSHLDDIVKKPYVVCEKTDGIRVLFYTSNGNVFLIDRQENVRALNMRMPKASAPNENLKGTLLDGELVMDFVIDQMSEGGNLRRPVLRYLVYDAIAVDTEEHIKSINLFDRLMWAFKFVIKPRRDYEKNNIEEIEKQKRDNNYFEMYLKDFFEVSNVRSVWSLATRLPHYCDGLIFTPVDLPYVPGTCMQLLKWKPPELNTVDFGAAIYWPECRVVASNSTDVSGSSDAAEVLDGEDSVMAKVGIRLKVARMGNPSFEGLWLCRQSPNDEKFFDAYRRLLENPLGVYLECKFDTEVITHNPMADEKKQGGWIIERIRTDRQMPNDVGVVNRVLQSLEDGVTFEILVKHIRDAQAAGQLVSATNNCLVSTDYASHGYRQR